MAEVAVSLPFSIDSFGKVSQTSDQRKIWSDKVLSVIGTVNGERVMRPGFGTAVAEALYEGIEGAREAVEEQIRLAFTSQLTQLTLTNVVISTDPASGELSAEVSYQLPNEEVQTTTVGIVQLLGNSPLIEVQL